MKDNNNKIPADNPIEDEEGDRLGRSETARRFARTVLGYDARRGAVVGLFGPWGSGKTSFINLARKEFKANGISIVEFNPWVFSSSEQLVERFFTEIASQLKIPKYKDMDIDIVEELMLLGADFVTNAMTVYSGGYLKPIENKWHRRRQYIEARKKNEGWGIINRRKNIEKALESLGRSWVKMPRTPIIVIVDDVDRLSNKEIGDVFRLIRHTASFPNIIYIVPCDRRRIEDALDNEHGIGKDFLDKIIQFNYSLPEISQTLLINEIDDCIGRVRSIVECQGPLDEEILKKVCDRIVYPLVQNMRDVRRYSAAVQSTLSGLGGRVEQADVLALEAVRLFIPEAFKLLPNTLDILAKFSHLSGRTRYSETSEQSYRNNEIYYGIRLAELFSSAREHAWEIRSMVKILFPGASKFIPGLEHDPGPDTEPEHNETPAIPKVVPKSPTSLSNMLDDDAGPIKVAPHRIANMDIFLLYLDQIPNEGVETLEDFERLLGRLAYSGVLHKYLRSLSRQRFRNLVVYLDYYEDKLSPEYAEPGIIELSNYMMEVCNMHDIQLASQIFDPNPERSLTRVVIKLLKSISPVDEELFLKMFDSIEPLSVKCWLVEEINRSDDQTHALISNDGLNSISDRLCKLISSVSVDRLAAEWYLPHVLFWSRENCPDGVIHRDGDPRFIFLVLWAFRSQDFNSTHSVVDTWSTDHKLGISWNSLIEYYGTPTLIPMVRGMCSHFYQVRAWPKINDLSNEDIEFIREEAEKWLEENNDEKTE